MAIFSVLEVVRGTDSVSFLRGEDGFYLKDWRPSSAEFKRGGIWQASPLVDGRRLVAQQWNNAIETFVLLASGTDADEVILHTQNLRRILQSGVDYWTSERGLPVYITAVSKCETEKRYAVVKSWSMPNDVNPYAQPFMSAGDAVMNDLILNIERGHWQSTPPGTGECQEISGLGVGVEGGAYAPSATLDDVHIVLNLSLLQDYAAQAAGISPAANTYQSGIRFRTVTIPNSAVIKSAYIEFQAAANDSIDCRLQIIGEQTNAPAAYSTFANFRTRLLTNAAVVWPTVEPWTQGAKYRTPDITAIVQEIVDLVGWNSGDDMAIQVWELGSSTGGWREWASVTHPTYSPATLNVVWESGDQVGRASTCEREVFVANKHNLAQLTHIFVDDGGVFGANQVASTAYNLTPAVPVLNDAVYFGVDTTTADSGPFFSLVFDLSAVDSTGNFVWEYWNGAAWHAFTALEIVDNTSGDQFNNPFRVDGVRVVCWDPQADWATTAVNAVTGYWVRCRCTVAADVVTQQNRAVYSVLWPSVTIEDADDIGGDIPAIIEVQFEPKSKATGVDISSSGPLFSSKALIGLRSLSRGENFTPFINLQNEQNPDGITVTLGASTSQVADSTATTGLHTLWNPAGVVAQAPSVTVAFSRDLALEYYGLYRMFLRGVQSGGGADELFVQIEQVVNTYTTIAWSPVRSFVNTVSNQVLDFGIWRLPSFGDVNFDEGVTGLQLVVNVESTDAAPGDLKFYDLILFPVDEWAGEFRDTSTDAQGWIGGDRGDTGIWRYLSVDSIGSPKRNLRSLVKVGDEDVRHSWSPTVNGPAILQSNAAQRMWFMSWANNNAGSLADNNLIADPYVTSTVVIKKAQRYLSMRGAR